jgi:hypothetical protein
MAVCNMQMHRNILFILQNILQVKIGTYDNMRLVKDPENIQNGMDSMYPTDCIQFSEYKSLPTVRQKLVL